jgi:hypothetical protein
MVGDYHGSRHSLRRVPEQDRLRLAISSPPPDPSVALGAAEPPALYRSQIGMGSQPAIGFKLREHRRKLASHLLEFALGAIISVVDGWVCQRT